MRGRAATSASREPAGEVLPPFEHAASIDVEDYRQILARRYRGDPGRVSEAFERDMDEVLAVLDAARTTATFFVTGVIAEQRPDLPARWAALGHEIACHGYAHVPIWTMTPDALREELCRSKALLEEAIGAPVCGYRAPAFSVRWDTLWALDVVAECGFAYDSSIVPVRTRRYGVAEFDRRPAHYRLASGREIVEIPISTARVWGRHIPIAGGGYFRLFSFRRIHGAVAESERQGVPFVMYCHPDEFGHEKFSAAGLATRFHDRLAGLLVSLKSNIGRQKVRGLVRRLLSEFRFSTLARLADRVRTDGTPRLLGTAR